MLPTKRTSLSMKRKRRSHLALAEPGFEFCPQCDRPKLHHAACEQCGYVNGRLAIKVGQKAEEK